MWTKTLTVKFQKKDVQVQVWLSNTPDTDQEVVSLQSMVNEYYLCEDITVPSRDAAYDLIKNFPTSMALAFVTRQAYTVGAVD